MKTRQQKTREPYGKVIEIGQITTAISEISELASLKAITGQRLSSEGRLALIKTIADSIEAVVFANPGCLSQMAEQSQSQMEVQS